MGSEDDPVDTHFHLGLQHIERILDGARTMVHTRQDVAMDIGIIEKLNLLFFIPEYVQQAHILHSYNSIV